MQKYRSVSKQNNTNTVYYLVNGFGFQNEYTLILPFLMYD